MSDETKIESVLTPLEWEEVRAGLWPLTCRVEGEVAQDSTSDVEAIGILNDRLPDGDRRKITWADVDAITRLMDEVEEFSGPERRDRCADVRATAAKLASYLPPEGT